VSSTVPSESPLPHFYDDGPLSYVGNLSRSNSSRSNAYGSMRRKSSGGGGGGDISYLDNAEHTRETADTHFIRAATGRGSIKRGPAPTKASQLRQLVR
jgi:hypothetical protein